MTEPTVLSAIDPSGTATVTLNRPDIHNAFDDALIAGLTAELTALREDEAVRAVVLAGAGKSFSAGADLNWMRRMADYSEHENREDALALGGLFSTIRFLPKPTIARVHGAAFGGALGLIGACDIAIAADEAVFAISEAKLGLIPAVISPYVIAAMGERQARRYALTGERFGAAEALSTGLVHQVVAADELDGAIRTITDELAKNGPNAMAEIKSLIAAVAGRSIDAALIEETAERIARVRAGEEGREGVGAFLDKRKPNWIKE